jgi:uncharacterized membrane protein
MTWHQSHHAVDEVMVHPSDGEAWKHFNNVRPNFLAESYLTNYMTKQGGKINKYHKKQ